jgi:uncharacterized damage-inducible protein DinB
MIGAAELRTLYDYGYWANGKLFLSLQQLTPPQFTESVGGSYGSIRNTMVHVVSAEWGWLDRCGGRARGARLSPDDYPTLASLMARASTVESYVREFLSGLSDADVVRRIEYQLEGPKESTPLGDLMVHAHHHGVHHRGQVAMLVRMLGYAPGNFDFLFYSVRPQGGAISG